MFLFCYVAIPWAVSRSAKGLFLHVHCSLSSSRDVVPLCLCVCASLCVFGSLSNSPRVWVFLRVSLAVSLLSALCKYLLSLFLQLCPTTSAHVCMSCVACFVSSVAPIVFMRWPSWRVRLEFLISWVLRADGTEEIGGLFHCAADSQTPKGTF